MGRMSRLNAQKPSADLPKAPGSCCECGRTSGLLIRWIDPPTQFVCPRCARRLDYPEYCYASCAEPLGEAQNK